MTLKDGTEPEDPRLGRVPELDPRNLNWLMRTIMKPAPIRSRRWKVRRVLDQRSTDACVSFGNAHAAISTPVAVIDHEKLTFDLLVSWYHQMQHIDPWAGCNWGRSCPVESGPKYGGTSEEAGLQIYQSLGFFGNYRWGKGIEDLARGVSRNGPSLVGTDWHASMFTPKNGLIEKLSGGVSGGHQYVISGIRVPSADRWLDGDGLITNSWGGWGDEGTAWIPLRLLGELLEARGTCSWWVGRRYRPKALR